MGESFYFICDVNLNIQTILSFLGVLFLFFWISRWFIEGAQVGLNPLQAQRYHTFLHAGLLTSFICFLMNIKSFHLWSRNFEITPMRMVLLLYSITSTLGAFLLIFPFVDEIN